MLKNKESYKQQLDSTVKDIKNKKYANLIK
mgnify:FL=1